MATQPCPSRRPHGARWLALALALGVQPIAVMALEPSVLQSISEAATDFDVTLQIETPECPPGDGFEVLESTAVLRAEPMPATDAECNLATVGEDFRTFEIRVPLGGSRTTIEHQISGLLIDDLVSEGCEVFQLRVDRVEGGREIRCVSNPVAKLIPAGHLTRVVIDDDESATRISIIDSSIVEGDAGVGQAVFQVRLAAPTFNTVGVSWATEDGSATAADGDYQPASGRLTFVYPETEKRITIPVFGDRRCEGDESFQVRLFVPKGADVDASGAKASLLDDDGAPRVVKVSEDKQIGVPGMPIPLAVRVLDGDNPLEGVTVRWDVTSGNARANPPEVSTNGDGRAETNVFLGGERQRANIRAVARVAGCPDSSTTFQVGSKDFEPLLDEIPPQGTIAVEGARNIHRSLEDRMKSIRGPSDSSAPRPISGFSGRVTSSGRRPGESDAETGFDFDLETFAVGLDAELGGGFLVGGALAYTEGDARLQGRGGGLVSRTWSASLFSAWQAPLDRGHVEGILTWGRPRFSTERIVQPIEGDPRLARARPEGTLWALSLGGGSGSDFGALRLEGFGYLHWARVEIDRYIEAGADDLNLEVFDQRQESLLAEAGVELLYCRGYERWGLALHLGSSFLHELEDDARPITARLVGNPDELLRHLTDPPDRDYFNLEAGATAKLPGPWSAYLSLHKEVNRDDLETQSLLVGILYQFH